MSRSPPMEQLTVHRTSYKPLPLERRRITCRDNKVRPFITAEFDANTVYGSSYPKWENEILREQAPPPKDHSFPGDGLGRYETTQRTHYTVKPIGRENDSPCKPQTGRNVIKVPIEDKTTMQCAYQKPLVTEPDLCLNRQRVFRTSLWPMETMSVHRVSYKPLKTPVLLIRNESRPTAELHRSEVPIERCTTYTTHYSDPCGCCKNEQPTVEEITYKKAHDYS